MIHGLALANASLIGVKAEEWSGRQSSFAPAVSMRSRDAVVLEEAGQADHSDPQITFGQSVALLMREWLVLRCVVVLDHVGLHLDGARVLIAACPSSS